MIPNPETIQLSRLLSLPGIGPAIAKKIAFHFGGEEETFKVLRDDPYRLIEVEGIGFRRADRIATGTFGVMDDDPRRHVAGNAYIVEQGGGRLSETDYGAKRWAMGLRDTEFFYAGVVKEPDLLSWGNEYVWTERELQAEQELARYLARVRRVLPLRDSLLELPPVAQHLNSNQQQAVNLFQHPDVECLCLTGSAGTGKTATIAEMIRAVGMGNARVMSFAGKAAQRASEALAEAGVPKYAACTTIHRALEYNPFYGFQRGYWDERLIIVDEASMVPNWLLAEVVKRVPLGSKLVLVGDVQQLPPIGLGFPFRDFIESKCPTVRLEQNYRQAERPLLFSLCEGIRTRNPSSVADFRADIEGEVELKTNLTSREFNNWCEALFGEELGGLMDWQAITYRNADRERINLELQSVYNPNGQFVFDYMTRALPKEESCAVSVKIGDKVAVRQNSYDLDIFNGQTGIVLQLIAEDRSGPEFQPAAVVVEIDGRNVEIPLELAPDLLELAYCITCHKAQGSGWDTVLILQPDSVAFGSNRWWYTAVSRAKKRLVMLTRMGARTWWANASKAEIPEPSTLLERVKFGGGQ
jgi:exodeoxyribonuclease V alpha subunit